MISLFLLPLLVFVAYAWLRQSDEKRHWSDQTDGERSLLSIAFAIIIQYLFVTMIPGWFIAVSIFGKGGFAETPIGNELFSFAMTISNIIIYFLPFYLLLGWLFNRQRKNLGKTELISFSSLLQDSQNRDK